MPAAGAQDRIDLPMADAGAVFAGEGTLTDVAFPGQAAQRVCPARAGWRMAVVTRPRAS